MSMVKNATRFIRKTTSGRKRVDMTWSDLGSFQTLWEMAERDSADNALIGDVLAHDAHGNYVRADGGRPVAVVDLDYHQGDGTRSAFADDESVLTYSLHGSTWSHSEARADFGLELETGTSDEAYLDALRRTLPGLLAEHRTGLVILIAGHDVLAGDSLGDFALTPAGVAARDRFVVQWGLERRVPVVVVLGGGYGRGGASCVASLVRWLLTGDTSFPGTPASELRRHFTRIAAQLESAELQREPGGADWTLSEEELMGGLGRRSPPPRLLDFYTSHGVELAFERYGVLDRLRRHGFEDGELYQHRRIRPRSGPRDPAGERSERLSPRA